VPHHRLSSLASASPPSAPWLVSWPPSQHPAAPAPVHGGRKSHEPSTRTGVKKGMDGRASVAAMIHTPVGGPPARRRASHDRKRGSTTADGHTARPPSSDKPRGWCSPLRVYIKSSRRRPLSRDPPPSDSSTIPRRPQPSGASWRRPRAVAGAPRSIPSQQVIQLRLSLLYARVPPSRARIASWPASHCPATPSRSSDKHSSAPHAPVHD